MEEPFDVVARESFDLLCEGKQEEALELCAKAIKLRQGVSRMLECDGYKMFRGTVRVTPAMKIAPFDLTGTWLWKPDLKCWYCKPKGGGFVSSWPPDVLSNFRENAV